MSQDLSTIMPKILARALMTLRQRAIMPRLVNGDYSQEASQKGNTINVPVPTAVTVSDVTPSQVPPAGTGATPGVVQIVLSHWRKNDPFYMTDKDMLETDANAYFVPMQVGEAIKGLAADFNASIHALHTGVYGYVGTAGTAPFGSIAKTTDVANARKVLNQQLAPRTDRRMVLDFNAEASALALPELTSAEKIGDNQVVIEGEIGRKFGFDWYADDQVATHTAGTITTSLISKAATAYAVGVTTLLATTAASTGACALVVGDIITFAGDNQTYVLTAAATQASAATDVTLTFQPPLKVAHVGSEAVTVKATHVVNLAFHRDAFAFATRPLASVSGEFALGSKIMTMQDPVTGLVLRLEVSRQYKQVAWEFDILWGVTLVRPELACRIAG